MHTNLLRAFWLDFEAKTDGARRPAVLELGALADALVSPEDGMLLMDALFKDGGLSVNIGGKLCRDARLLPPPRNIDQYADFVHRLAELNGSDTITFTQDYCLKYAPRLASRIRSFTHPFTLKRGVPVAGVNAVFIGGYYRATWIGLHNDFCDTLLIPIVGPKNMLIWPPDYYKDKALIDEPALNGICYGHIDLSSYKEDSLILTAGPGQVMFIPAYWWHYNDLALPELTMTLSVGIFNKSPLKTPILAAATAAAAIVDSGAPCGNPLPPKAGVISADLRAVEIDARLDAAFEHARFLLRLQVLQSSSCGGVIGFSPQMTVHAPLIENSFVGRADGPVYLVTEMSPYLLIAGGQVRAVNPDPIMERLVEKISAGYAFKPSECLDEATHNRNMLEEHVSWLYASGSLEPV